MFGANLSQSETKKSANELIPMTAPVEMSSESISMTSPVEISSGTTLTMRFVMPSSYQIETLPIPNDSRVTIRSLPGETLAVLSYNGRRKPKTIARKAEGLSTAIAMSDWRIVTTTPLREFYYNPPWTVPIFRHNEVAFAVELKP
ncbi:MAG: heme-binding protein [Alphaproteobacteria bacterium]|nr:heme-binding protein [Alphaproteobacteria bacterium]